MSVSIPLLPMHTLGRNFQLLALALGDVEGRGEVRAETDSIEFPSADAYVRFVKNTYEVLYSLHVGKTLLLKDDIPEEVEKEMCSKKSPKLYGNDTKPESKLKKELQGENVCQMATSYVRRVIKKTEEKEKGPLGISLKGLPITLKATLYNEERPLMHIAKKSKGVSLDSVGMAFIGMVASYMGMKSDPEKVEYYVVLTDLSNREYVASVLQVLKMLEGEELPSIVQKLENINLSADIATYLAFLLKALKAQETNKYVFELAEKGAYENFFIVKVKASGNRPDVTWAAPLSLSVPLEMVREQNLQEALKSVYALASSLRGGKDKERAEAVVKQCFNSLALSIFTNIHPVGREELRYSCIRAAIVALHDEEVSDYAKRLVEKIIEDIGR